MVTYNLYKKVTVDRTIVWLSTELEFCLIYVLEVILEESARLGYTGLL